MPLQLDQIKASIAKAKAKLAEKQRNGVAQKPEGDRKRPSAASEISASKRPAFGRSIPETQSAAFNAPVPLPSGPISFSGNAISALQAKVQAQVAALRAKGGKPGSVPGQKKALGLKLDSQGRVVDASGNVLDLQQRRSEFAVNARAKRQEQLNHASQLAQTDQEDLQSRSFYDERLDEYQKPDRKKRALKFHVPGSHVERAERIRAKEKLEKLQSEIASAAQQTGLSAATKLALTIPKKEELVNNDVPDVEWWDQVVVGTKGYDTALEDKSKLNDITSLIQHPVMFDPPGRKKSVMPVYLTKKERAKMRRQRRRAMQEEKQEKIRLGLEEAPPPKVKISNLMRVLGREAVQDPTKVENLVRAQMQLRQQQHDNHNSSRQLSKFEKSAKKAKKLQDDMSHGVFVAVFSIKTLKNERHKFKVETNAKQYNLTGCTIMTDAHNLVVVEGGPRNIRKYKRLLLVRMKWNEKALDMDEDEDEDEEEDLGNGDDFCKLIWEGTLEKKSFKQFDVKLFRSEMLAREWLDKRRTAHYWDMALTGQMADEE